MREETVEVKWNGEALKVTGSLYKGCKESYGDYPSPAEPASFEIHTIIWLNNIVKVARNSEGKRILKIVKVIELDVTDLLLSNDDISEVIAEDCLEAL